MDKANEWMGVWMKGWIPMDTLFSPYNNKNNIDKDRRLRPATYEIVNHSPTKNSATKFINITNLRLPFTTTKTTATIACTYSCQNLLFHVRL